MLRSVFVFEEKELETNFMRENNSEENYGARKKLSEKMLQVGIRTKKIPSPKNIIEFKFLNFNFASMASIQRDFIRMIENVRHLKK